MKYFLSSIILLGLFTVSIASYAKSPGAKPRCETGKIAERENGSWRCVEPDITERRPTHRNLPAGPHPKCKQGQRAKMVKGALRCVKSTVRTSHPTQRNNPAGKTPKCKPGKLPKKVGDHWTCMKPNIQHHTR